MLRAPCLLRRSFDLSFFALAFSLLASFGVGSGSAAESAPPAEQYADQLWGYLTGPTPYTGWKSASVDDPAAADALKQAPRLTGAQGKLFWNAKAAAGGQAAQSGSLLPHGSMLVVEQLLDGKPASILALFRVQPGYDAQRGDWYWASFLPSGKLIESSLDRRPFAKPGFQTLLVDGRLWVLRSGSKDQLDFHAHGELAKNVTRLSAGPARLTLKGPDADVLTDYLYAQPGFWTRLEDGRLWVFREGSKDLAEYQKSGDLAKRLVRPGAGPHGMTLMAPDAETIDAYRFAKPGFITQLVDGRLWVFRAGAPELADFQKHGELAKNVTLPGKGPNGLSLRAPDSDTAHEYLYCQPGFKTQLVDGRLWVFQAHGEDFVQFRKHGELAKHVTRLGAGPNKMTLRAPDAETIDLYRRSLGL